MKNKAGEREALVGIAAVRGYCARAFKCCEDCKHHVYTQGRTRTLHFCEYHKWRLLFPWRFNSTLSCWRPREE